MDINMNELMMKFQYLKHKIHRRVAPADSEY